jgi:HK97 family phage major capsid protein
MNSVELRQQRADLVGQTKAWLTSIEATGRDMSGEEETEWAKRNTEIDRLEAEAKRAERKERMEHVEADLAQPVQRKTSPTAPANYGSRTPSKGERNKVWKSWLGYGLPHMRHDGETMHRAAEMGMPLHQNCVEWRSLNTASAGAGGNTTFTTVSPDLQSEMKYYSPIMGKVTVRNTADGNNFVIPRATDVANAVTIISQSGSSPINVDPSFDKVTFGAYMARTVVQVTFEMLQDSVFDVEAYVTATLAERFGRQFEQWIVAGTGSGQPTGVLTSAVANGAATTLAATKKSFYRFEDLFTLFASVDLAYRPNCTLLLNDSSVWDLRKIVDSQGRYIWDVNNTLVQNAQPDKIAGFNYLVSNSIPASNAFSTKIACFADLSRHVVRMVDGVQLTKLNELYRASGIIGVECLARLDSNYIGHASSYGYVVTPAS